MITAIWQRRPTAGGVCVVATGCSGKNILGVLLSTVGTACITPVVATSEIQGVGLYVVETQGDGDIQAASVSGLGLAHSHGRWFLGVHRLRYLTIRLTDEGSAFESDWLSVWTGKTAEALAEQETITVQIPRESK